jgi:chloramphenicol 3-O-phosphotransferase
VADNGSSEVPRLPFLPGQAIDRETAAGWQRWRLTRHSFVPAPRLEWADYQHLTPRERRLHDLHRAVTHANLPFQETPMSAAVAQIMSSRIQTNALKHKPTTRAGLLINGGGYQGKTETACEVAAAFADQWLALHGQRNPDAVAGTRDLHAPVAYVQTPVTATPKMTCEAILDFYGADHKNMTLGQLIRAVRGSLYDHGTRVLLLDDITRLKLHREADQDALDLIRSLMSMNVTLVLIGVAIPSSGLLREGRHDPRTGQWVFPPPKRGRSWNDEAATQTERRFDLVNLDPFRYDTPADIAAWIAHLAGIQQHLRLFQAAPGMLTDGGMPEYLFRRTCGIVGLLERLIEDGCMLAIDTGQEHLTATLLDSIELNLGNVPGRDPTAGEVPPVPPRPGPLRRRRSGLAASGQETPSSTTTATKARRQRQPTPEGSHTDADHPAPAAQPGPAPGRVRARLCPAVGAPA